MFIISFDLNCCIKDLQSTYDNKYNFLREIFPESHHPSAYLMKQSNYNMNNLCIVSYRLIIVV